MTTYPTTGAHAEPAYPASFGFDAPERIANWRPLVHWLLVIPHLLVVAALQRVAQALAVISWFAILFTGRLPAGIARFQAMYIRYAIRTATYTGFLREEYPPFTLDTTTTDPGDDPRVHVDVDPQIEDRHRLTTGFRLILVSPHLIALAILAIALAVVAIIGFFAVLFTGQWPEAPRTFALGVGRWWVRVQAYMLLLTDQYPPFTLDDLPMPQH
jgi:hypothetical protein